jgi:hypothetical protein
MCIKIYRTIILPVILYGCETWSVTLREEHRLRVFENGVLRGIFGPKRDEVTRSGGNYTTNVFLTRYYSSDQIKKNEMGGACGTYGTQQICIQSFDGEI